MNKPDFEQWAANISINFTARKLIQEGLERSYRMGYKVGLEQGWAIEQDRSHGNMCACAICNGDLK